MTPSLHLRPMIGAVLSRPALRLLCSPLARAIPAIALLGAAPVLAEPIVEVVTAFATPPVSPISGPLAPGPDGYLWGATYSGGVHYDGTLYKVKPDGTEWQHILSFELDGATNKGENPNSGLLFHEGSFWGTTQEGGAQDHGTIFKYDPVNDRFTTVLQFTDDGAINKGRNPSAGLIVGPDRHLWGTTYEGGAGDNGTVFKLNPNTNTLTTVIQFTGNGASNRGARPLAGLSLGPRRTLWGTTTEGGPNELGTAFKLDPVTGALTTVVEFTGTGGSAPGSRPLAGLVNDRAGFLWGTTFWGGRESEGTVYKIDATSGAFTSVVAFEGLSAQFLGANPRTTLTPDGSGFMWGVTEAWSGSGGTTTDNGTVYKINIATHQFTSIATFNGRVGPILGSSPWCELYHDPSGFMWGTTAGGGLSGNGTVFRVQLSTERFETVIDFTTESRSPRASLVADADGFLWGISGDGGPLEYGTIFKIDPASGQATSVIEFSDDGPRNRGRNPNAGLVADERGWLWGTTYRGGVEDDGTVFKIDPKTGMLTTVREISGFDPANPNSALTPDGKGFFWGTCWTSGGNGDVFKIDADTGQITRILRFTRRTGAFPGAFPSGGLVPDETGWLWGVTRSGGDDDYGTVFKVDPANGQFVSVVQFTGRTGARQGQRPIGGLALDASGFMWGTTEVAGVENHGVVFKVDTATGAFSRVLDFTDNAPNPGRNPNGSLLFDGRLLWGFTEGTIYTINPRTGTFTSEFSLAQPEVRAANPGSPLSDGRFYRHSDGHIYGATENSGPGGDGAVFRIRFGPSATTLPAIEITSTGATLRGSVNPNGRASLVQLLYGTSPSLDDPTTVPLGIIESGNAQSFAHPVTGLAPGTTYYFRIGASNGENPSVQYGQVLAFTTIANLPPELVGFQFATSFDQPAKLAVAKLLRAAHDPEGDPVEITGAGPDSVAGGQATLDLSATTLHYSPPAGFSGPDQFSITLTDSKGASAVAVVTVQVRPADGPGSVQRNPAHVTIRDDGTAVVRFTGLPNWDYVIERSTDLNQWEVLGTVTAGPTGQIRHEDPNPPQPFGYYRLVGIPVQARNGSE